MPFNEAPHSKLPPSPRSAPARGEEDYTAGTAAAGRARMKADTISTGLKLLFCLGLSVSAFGNRTFRELVLLSAINMMLLLFQPFRLKTIRRGVLFFLSQSAVIVVLYLMRFQSLEALWSGFKTSLQLFLAFLPGYIFAETTSHAKIIRTLTCIMSHRTAFVMSTCIKFLPLLAGEIRSIYEGQVMRGARIRPQDLYKPWNWPDIVHCLIVPAVIHSMKLSGDIALAAKARDFGMHKDRTCWPGD